METKKKINRTEMVRYLRTWRSMLKKEPCNIDIAILNICIKLSEYIGDEWVAKYIKNIVKMRNI